jgi:hypothetical protein
MDALIASAAHQQGIKCPTEPIARVMFRRKAARHPLPHVERHLLHIAGRDEHREQLLTFTHLPTSLGEVLSCILSAVRKNQAKELPLKLRLEIVWPRADRSA